MERDRMRKRSRERKRDLSIAPLPLYALPSGHHLSVSGFFSPCARNREQRDAWLLKRCRRLMTRTICSGVSTRLFLFSSARAIFFFFCIFVSPCSPSLFARLPAPVSPLRSPTDDAEAGRALATRERIIADFHVPYPAASLISVA